jgi:hypothetical protein
MDAAFYQQSVSHGKKLGVMLEVFRSSLHGVHDVCGGKR